MDDGYDLDGSSAAANALQADYLARSEAAAALPGARLDLAYGPDPRQRLDVFCARPGAPALVFFHGGYWRAGSKDSRRFPAPAWRARGVSWVCVNYRLAPGHPLSAAVADARQALVWLAGNAAGLGLSPERLHVCGNSAGGHLAAMVAADGWPGRPPLRSLATVSGLHDLAPLVQATPNVWLQLTPDTAHDLSPLHHMPPRDMPVLVALGGAETAAFRAQSDLYADALRDQGTPMTRLDVPGADHFEVIAGFGAEGHPLFAALADPLGRA